MRALFIYSDVLDDPKTGLKLLNSNSYSFPQNYKLCHQAGSLDISGMHSRVDVIILQML